MPLVFEMYAKRKHYADRKEFRTKVKVAMGLTEEAFVHSLCVHVIALDSRYMSEELTSFVKERGIAANI